MIRLLNNSDNTEYERFLGPYAATSMFLRSNVLKAGLEYQGKEFQGEYFAAFNDAGNIKAVLVHYWNSNIMMQAGSLNDLEYLISDFKTKIARPVGGILGPDAYVQKVIEALGLINSKYVTNRNEDLFDVELEDLIIPDHISLDRVSIIPAKNVEHKILAAWLKAYELETHTVRDPENHDQQIKDRVERTQKNGDVWALEVDGVPVSLSGFNARLPDVVQVGPVWTPIEHRNKGYARLLVALTLESEKKQGIKKAVLFTDTPAAVKAYKSIGFKDAGSFRLALLEKEECISHPV